MKKILTITLITFLAIGCATKTPTDNSLQTIKKDFTNYLNLITDKKFEKAMDYIPAIFFEIFPKEQMIKLMEQTFNSSDIEIQIDKAQILNVDAIEKIEDTFFSKIRYIQGMKLRLKGDEETTEMTKKLMKISFEKSFGKENVSYNEETKFFNIKSTKDAVAISKNNKKDWKFLVVEKKSKFILEKILPKKIFDSL